MGPLTEGDPGRVGPYTTVGRLGVGALGVLYAGRSDDGRAVAVRALQPELLADESVKARLAADIAAARTVSSPYAAPVLGVDLEAAAPWLAAGFVGGLTLAQTVADHGPLPEPTLLTLAAGIAEALSAVHAAGVMHGDLRPGTVLLTADGPRVVDYALVGAFEGAAEVGVAGFLAPEQARRRTAPGGFHSPEPAKARAVTPAADMFALGSTLFFAAMGRAPFGDGTAEEVKARVAKSSPVLGKLPAALSELIRGCFQKDPNSRAQPQQVLEYVQRRAPVRLGSGWLPAGVAAQVRAVAEGSAAVGSTVTSGPVVGGDGGTDADATMMAAPAVAPGGAGGFGGQMTGFGAGQLGGGGDTADATPSGRSGDFGAGQLGGAGDFGPGPAQQQADAGAPPTGQMPAFGQPQPGMAPAVTGASQPAPSRRNLLLALTGGAVVVGGGTALVMGLGGSSGTTSTADAEPAAGAGAPPVSATSAAGAGALPSATPSSPAQRSLPPGGALPPPAGALGKLQGPSAKTFWTQDVTGRVSSMAAGDGVLVVATDGGVSCLDLSGAVTWGPLPAKGIAGSGNGVVAAGVAYLIVSLPDAPGQVSVLALDVKAGAPRWTTPLPAGPGPLSDVRVAGMSGGKLFVVGMSGSTPSLWVLNSLGGVVWNKAGAQYATLTVPAKGTQVLVAGSEDLNTRVTAAALDIGTGEQAWARQLGTSVDYSRVSLSKAAYVGDHYVLLSSSPDGDVLAAGNTATGQDAWTSKLPEPAGDAGTVSLVAKTPDASAVIALSRTGLYAVAAETGKLLWQSQGTESSFITASDGGTPRIADGNVYVCDQKGSWWAVDLATGRTRWKYATTGFEAGADPVWIAVAGGVVTASGSNLTMVLAKG